MKSGILLLMVTGFDTCLQLWCLFSDNAMTTHSFSEAKPGSFIHTSTMLRSRALKARRFLLCLSISLEVRRDHFMPITPRLMLTICVLSSWSPCTSAALFKSIF